MYNFTYNTKLYNNPYPREFQKEVTTASGLSVSLALAKSFFLTVAAGIAGLAATIKRPGKNIISYTAVKTSAARFIAKTIFTVSSILAQARKAVAKPIAANSKTDAKLSRSTTILLVCVADVKSTITRITALAVLAGINAKVHVSRFIAKRIHSIANTASVANKKMQELIITSVGVIGIASKRMFQPVTALIEIRHWGRKSVLKFITATSKADVKLSRFIAMSIACLTGVKSLVNRSTSRLLLTGVQAGAVLHKQINKIVTAVLGIVARLRLRRVYTVEFSGNFAPGDMVEINIKKLDVFINGQEAVEEITGDIFELPNLLPGDNAVTYKDSEGIRQVKVTVRHENKWF